MYQVICHGCSGKGWVDSLYAVPPGPTICPLCKGSGLPEYKTSLTCSEESLDLELSRVREKTLSIYSTFDKV
jgi:DnaJ-class molecular chaperone